MKLPVHPLAGELSQSVPAPSDPRPIIALGAGNIVREAHIPAYRATGIPYAGFFDIDSARARATRDIAGEGEVFVDLAAAIGTAQTLGALGDRVVFDIAVPAEQILSLVSALPVGSAALIQKPLGRNLAEAEEIAAVCEARSIVASVNFQLRSAPAMLALHDAISRGLLGTPTECEFRVNLFTPWGRWAFLEGIPRMEILYHSIHYLDLVRHLFGDPTAIRGVSHRDSSLPNHADTRTTLICDGPPGLRTLVHTNHAHDFGRRHGASELRVEGTDGAAVVRMGVNLDYPRGAADSLEISEREGDWHRVPLRGNWFPAAFEGPMALLQRFLAGEGEEPWTQITDAVRTMALVEAAYSACTTPGTPIPGTGQAR